MELSKKHDHLKQALKSFDYALVQHKKIMDIDPKKIEDLGIDYQQILLNLRDSSIQRFEYSIDLLWKYLKTFLDIKLQIVPSVLSPATIIRETARARLISEDEAHTLLEMVKKRNMTSHIYQQEIAEILSADLPSYLECMQTVIEKVRPNDTKEN